MFARGSPFYRGSRGLAPSAVVDGVQSLMDRMVYLVLLPVEASDRAMVLVLAPAPSVLNGVVAKASPTEQSDDPDGLDVGVLRLAPPHGFDAYALPESERANVDFPQLLLGHFDLALQLAWREVSHAEQIEPSFFQESRSPPTRSGLTQGGSGITCI